MKRTRYVTLEKMGVLTYHGHPAHGYFHGQDALATKPKKRPATTVLPTALLAVAVLLTPAAGRTAVIDMRDAVADHDDLSVHYTFEGTGDERLKDKKLGSGHLTLQARAFGSNGNIDSIAFVQGFDATTTAFRPQFIDATNGAGLWGDSIRLLSSGFTVEMLVKPGDTDALGMAFMGPVSPDRGYPLFHLDGHLQLAVGNGAWDLSGARRIVVEKYVPDNWYYVAVSFEPSGNDTKVNGYFANLTAGARELSSSSFNSTSDATITGKYSTNGTNFGVGMSHLSKEPFNGLIDQLAIYNAVLPKSDLQAHLSLIPEPGAWLLALWALACGLLVRRRK